MSFQTRMGDFITSIGTDYKQIVTWITGSSSGDLTGLTTTDKSSLVAAINEVDASTPSDSSTTAKGIVELATLAEVATGTDTTRAVTAEGVRQERVALKAEILGAGVPAALDTLDELAAALSDDASFAGTITTALGSRVRTDTAAQGLDSTQQNNARTNISVYSKAEMGDPDTDLVAAYVAAKA